MDVLSHILWTFVIWPKSDYPLLPIIIAGLPDLIPLLSSIFYFSYKKKLSNFLFKSMGKKFVPRFLANHMGKGLVINYPKPIKFMYHFLHSIIIFIIVSIILIIILGQDKILTYLILLPWFFHIFIDIFAHGKRYKGPKFLFPLSNIRFKGLSYYSTPIIITNYIILVILIIIKLIK